MSGRVSDFLTAATADNIRANNTYEVTINTCIDPELTNYFNNRVVLFAKSVSLPARGIEYASVSYKGFDMANIVPTKMTMENDHTISFYADINGNHRRAFLKWMNYVMNANMATTAFEGDRGFDLNSTVKVHMLDANNTPAENSDAKAIETITFYGVRVTSVGALSMQYDGGDAATFDVQFKSTYWQSEHVSSSTAVHSMTHSGSDGVKYLEQS